MPLERIERRLRYNSSSVKNESLPAVLQKGPRVIYTAGRPPWYDSSGQMQEAFVIGICGGSGSGKTTVAEKIITALDIPWVSHLSMDCFYKSMPEDQRKLGDAMEYNFDHPDALDFKHCVETLARLKGGKQVDTPIYNFVTHTREEATKTLYGANVVVFEGILCLWKPELRELIDLKVFVDTDVDVCLSRRLLRDTTERGRTIESVLAQYIKFVKPAYEHYVAPLMGFADIIIPRGVDNEPAIDLIVKHVQRELHKRGFKVRSELINNPSKTQLPEKLHILEQAPLVRYLHTVIRNKETPRDDFIFYSKRLMRLLFEYALSLLSYEPVTVDTPQGCTYEGIQPKCKCICGISILRAGQTMEQALLECVDDALLGLILIQSSPVSGEPELFYLRLPEDIRNSNVFVMDATVATGAASMMAIRVLLDHGVPEENITVVSLLMASQGYQSIAYVYPKVTIVTSSVDPELNAKYHIVPGFGNFGDRFYGTEKLMY